jgi:16S rRNA U516 pseudouridylate synthase RsuA-like enzyme
VVQLHRSAYAGLAVDDLAPGQWRELTDGELATLAGADVSNAT